MFRSVQQPQGGAFFAQNGFLFELTDELGPQLKNLTQAQRLVQVLAGDPSLRGVIQALQFGLLGVQGGRITLDNMTWPMTLGADAIEKVNAGQPATFSWRDMVQGRAATPSERRKFLNIQGILDYSELEPGLKATDAIRKAAADLNFAGNYQANLRLTGPVPMADEEFATIKENAGLNATVTIAIVLFILWLALRWFRIIFAVFVSLVVGLAVTAAVGMLMVGTLNLISVYFAVLFVGLGVDFGLQFSVRYRAERHEVDDLHEALLYSGRRAGAPLTLAALATAAGFLSFTPTDYKGVSELGLIAGVGMLIAYFTSITLLPALLSRLKPPSEPHHLGYAALAPVDGFLERHRMPILIGTLLAVAAGLPLLYQLQFDFNPMNLRSKTAELVATYLELKNDPESGANDIGILQPTLAQADAVAAKLRALPQVGRVTTLSTFIPDQQSEKLALIADAAKTLNPALNPAAPAAPTSDAQTVSMINSTVDALNRLAGDGTGTGAVAAKRLAAAMTALAKADPSVRQRAEAVFVQPLKTTLDDLRNLLKAQEITRANLPPVLARDWVTPDGQARIDVAPKGDPNNNDVLRVFARAVQAVAPDATEGPISILGGAAHGRHRLPRRRRLRAAVDRHYFVDHVAADQRRAADPHPIAHGRRRHAGNLRVDRHAAEFRQHHRAAAVARRRRGVQDLLHHGLARRADQPVAIGADARRDVQRLHHGDRVRQPVVLQPPRHVEHGQAVGDFADDDDGGRGALSAHPDGQAAARAEGSAEGLRTTA